MSKYQDSDIQNAQNLSISCNSVPDALLDKTVAKTYFQQFGNVLRIRLRPKHKTIIVEYANEESAQNAFAEVGEYQGQDFIVSWTKNKSNDKRKVRKKLDDPNWLDDPEIKNELEAMKGNFTPSKNYNLRPEAMIVEQSQNNTKKSTLPKSNKPRQWKTEKPTKPKNNESMSDQENDLLKTIMTCASTNEEKFRVLDARDKLIRSRTVKQSELARAVRTIGTCPDMCPEKERLMREVQHQVAAYEQLAGSSQKNIMNHKLAVKQYSRSSADQESPLAHELRPVDVLHLTMGYLLHRIMDLCETSEVNLAEWYHFVWDRTRGIRKDVTQQELCCEKSVQLVEQCARFHVHCAARLVSEDVSVFDDKINTENLTKCLQTLKYMYHDLKVKHNISCKNEAEFRAYIVLLNLNDGNFMWEVQQLSPDIQRSHEIRFALNVYSALDKNNYVRFFKLIKSTSYLNACILLRYFNQVRYRALLTIIKSYSPRLPYPVDDLCKMLAFEDIPSTITFLEYHGLQLNVEKSHVLLDRNRFRQPDTPFALDRAINIVETKRQTSVGEVVCGDTLPPKYFETHLPHNSFDERGYLKITELPKDFQNKYQQFLKQFTEPEVPEVPEVDKPKTLTSKLEKPKSEGFVFKLPTETSTATPQDISEPDGEVQSFFGSIKNETTRSQSPLTTLKNETSRSQSPLTQQPENNTSLTNTFWGKSKTTFSTNIFGNTVIKPSTLKPTPLPVTIPSSSLNPSLIPIPNIIPNSIPAKPEIKPPTIQQPKEDTLKENLIKEKLIEEKLIQEKLLKEKLLQKQKEERERIAMQKLNEEKIKKQLLLEKKRQAELLYEKELQHQLQIIAQDVLNEVEENLIKNRLEQISENIKMRKVLQYGRRWRNLTKISKKKRKNFFDNPVWVSTRSVQQEAEELFTSSQDLTLHDIKRYKYGTPTPITLKNKRNVEKLDIYRIVWKILFERTTSEQSLNFDIFWKIGLSLPAVENKVLDGLLETCLGLNPTDATTLKQFKCNNGGSLNICIKSIQQNESSLNGIIFFYFDQGSFQVNQQRFEKIIHNKRQKNTSFPIVILTKSKHGETIAQQLKLNELLNTEIISKYLILQYTDDTLDEVLTKTLEFLATHFAENRNRLEANEVSSILRNCLGDEFWYRIRSSMELNKRFSILLQIPNNVINLFNEALKFCCKILFDSQNYKLPSFPTEFKLNEAHCILLPCSYEYFPDYWNSPSYLTKIKKIVKAFQLPKFNDEWLPKNQQDFQQTVEEYCRGIFKEHSTNILYKILSVVYRKFDLTNISWVDIIELIVFEKIHVTQFNDEKHPIYTIVYDVEEMREYRRIPWWFQLKTIQKGIKRIKFVEEYPEPEIITDITEEDTIDLDKTLNDLYNQETFGENKKVINDYNELNMLLDDLEKSMEIQKNIMKKFEERALMALD